MYVKRPWIVRKLWKQSKERLTAQIHRNLKQFYSIGYFSSNEQDREAEKKLEKKKPRCVYQPLRGQILHQFRRADIYTNMSGVT